MTSHPSGALATKCGRRTTCIAQTAQTYLRANHKRQSCQVEFSPGIALKKKSRLSHMAKSALFFLYLKAQQDAVKPSGSTEYNRQCSCGKYEFFHLLSPFDLNRLISPIKSVSYPIKSRLPLSVRTQDAGGSPGRRRRPGWWPACGITHAKQKRPSKSLDLLNPLKLELNAYFLNHALRTDNRVPSRHAQSVDKLSMPRPVSSGFYAGARRLIGTQLLYPKMFE